MSSSPSSDVGLRISVKTGERFEVPNGQLAQVRIPTVEVWLGGVKFTHDCVSDEDARRLVMHVTVDLEE